MVSNAWRKPDGDLKEMSCRVAMLRMHKATLPTKASWMYPIRKNFRFRLRG